MTIRKALLKDLEEMVAIYNYEVLNGLATFDIEEKTAAQRLPWFEMHNRDNHPLIVAEKDGRVVGYASLSQYRDKEAYNATVELSVYVSPHFRQKGAGGALMREILALAEADVRTHAVISVITSSNEASVHLHKKFGFEFCGREREVGFKFGKYQSTDTYMLIFSHR